MGIEAVRKFFQNILALGSHQRGLYLFLCGFRTGSSYIFQDRGLKQAVVLEYEGHLIHEYVGIDTGHINAANFHHT